MYLQLATRKLLLSNMREKWESGTVSPGPVPGQAHCTTQVLSSRVATRSTTFGNSQPKAGFLTACPVCKIPRNVYRRNTE